MKLKKLFCCTLPLIAAMGCVYSHRNPPVVYTTPTTTTVVPTSDRPIVRVYPESVPIETVTPPPAPAVVTTAAPVVTTAASSRDLAIADVIRRMFDADPAMASAARQVQVGVEAGRVKLVGAIPSRSESDDLQRRIRSIPDVVEVENKLSVGINH